MKKYLQKAWLKQSAWLKILRPLSALFTWIVALRRQYYANQQRSGKPAVPVVVVGNINLGGTGKTPIVLALIDKMQQMGYRPGVVSRGYGSAPGVRPLHVTAGLSAREVGDEPRLLADAGQVPVVIDPVRVNAIRYLLHNLDQERCDVVISDDGLQHYAMQRDIEIAVIDGVKGLGNARLLPEGPLREPVSRLEDVDYILQNGGVVPLHPRAYIFNLVPCRVYTLDQQTSVAIEDWIEQVARTRVHAVAGIGHPPRFFETLRAMSVDVIEHSFADHYVYSAADLHFNDGLPLIMTEKDAVKCRSLRIVNAWVLRVSAHLPEQFVTDFMQRLAQFQLRR